MTEPQRCGDVQKVHLQLVATADRKAAASVSAPPCMVSSHVEGSILAPGVLENLFILGNKHARLADRVQGLEGFTSCV